MSRAAAGAFVVAVALIVGCGGGGGSKQTPREAVESFAKAFGTGDGKKACSLLTGAGQRSFVTRARALTGANDCPTAIERVHDAAGGSVTRAYAAAKVVSVKVTGSKAVAQLKAGGAATTVALQKEGGDWKLTGVPGL